MSRYVDVDVEGYPVVRYATAGSGSTEMDPTPNRLPNEHGEQIAAQRIACRKSGDPEPPVHGVYGGWDH